MLTQSVPLPPHPMKMPPIGSVAACIALAAFAVDVASAAPALDQQSTSFNLEVTLDPTSSVSPIGQSFTAGLNGLLTDITLSAGGADGFGPNGSLTLTLFSGGGFGGTNLGSVTQNYTVPFAYIGSPFAFPLDINVSSIGLNVVSGTQYTFELSNTSGALQAGILGSSSNPYGGGQIYTGPGYGSPASWDLDFQTYVDQAANPPPPTSSVPDSSSTLGMLGIAVAGLVGLSRRRKRA